MTLLPPGAAGRELARGLPVRWTRPPNYARCTDPADSLQLTDGRSASGEHIWLDRRCVGWETEVGDPIALYVDLGRSCQLDSVVVCTAVCAPAEVELPSVFGAVGATLAQWTWAGDLDARTLSAAGAARARRVRLSVPLAGSGRTVLVIAVLRSHFFFTDEVEVHGSELPPGITAAPAGPRGPLGRPFARGELSTVAAAQRRAWALRAALPQLDAPAGTSANLAVAAEESLRLASRASAWRAAGAAPLRVRRVDPWTPTTPWSDLQAAVIDTLEMWPGAWGAAAIEAACAATVPARAALALAATAPGAPLGTLRVTLPVEARDGRWSGDALPLANGTLTVRPGEVRQVWIDLDASGASPGLHVLRVTVGAQQVDIPVRVRSLYPGVPPLHAVDWIYPEKFALTRTAAAEALRDNAAHGIDTWWIPAEALPWPDSYAIDSAGHLTAPLDFTACDRQLALHRAAHDGDVGFFWNFDARRRDPSQGRFRHPYDTPAWRQAVREWLVAWRAHLEALGYGRERVLMQPFDETTAAPVGRFFAVLHQLQPDLRLALTITRLATPGELPAIETQLAVAILERQTLAARAEWIRALTQRGVQVWTYDVLQPSKATPPVAGYRCLAWEAWARGLAGCGFWAYGDTGETSADAWDDYDDVRLDYAAVYGPAGAPLPVTEAFVPSKRWQAFRIGMQETALFESARRRDPGWPAAVLGAITSGEAGRHPEAWRRRALERAR